MALANHNARFSPCGYPSYAIRICHIWHVREVQAFPGLRARSRGGRGKGFRPYPGPSGGTDGKFGWYSSSETQGQKVGARESLNGPPLSAPGSPRMGGALPRQQARGVDSACERGGEARRLA